MKDQNAIRSYILTGRDTVEGWFDREDARTFWALDLAQQSIDSNGDLVEVGVYLGKCAILLGLLAEEGEAVLAVDLFDTPALVDEQRAEQERWYCGLTEERYKFNYGRFVTKPSKVLAGFSHDMLATIADNSARWIHIDGSHEYDAVRADAGEALRIATADAVIVFDDVLTSHTPGVTAAAWQAVLAGRLVPLIQTHWKLFTTPPGSALLDIDLAEFATIAGLVVAESHVVNGHPILEVAERDPGRLPMKDALHQWVPPAALPRIRKARALARAVSLRFRPKL